MAIQTLGRIEAPICRNCNVGMAWFRSELVQDDVRPLFTHHFVCPKCKGNQRRDSELAPTHCLTEPTRACGWIKQATWLAALN